jgi:glyoxylase-like metal-dependent hydrolase (beta-lactamase superfamily II)
MEFGDCSVRAITTGRWKEHCYVVRHVPSSEAIVIDPGEEADAIVAAMRADGAVPGAIVLTHAHYDHVGALAALGREFGIPFYLHEADAKLLRRAAMYALRFDGLVLAAPGEGRDVLTADLRLGGRPVRALHVPGHTEGGMAYAFEGFTFTGDTLLFQTVGRTDLPGGDARALRASVPRLLDWVGGDDTVLFAGHGRPWTAGDARRWWQTQGSEEAVAHRGA